MGHTMLIIHVSVGNVAAEPTSAPSLTNDSDISPKYPQTVSYLSPLNRPHLGEVLSFVLMTSVSISLDASIEKSRLTTVFEMLIFRPIRGFLASGPGFGEDILFLLLL